MARPFDVFPPEMNFFVHGVKQPTPVPFLIDKPLSQSQLTLSLDCLSLSLDRGSGVQKIFFFILQKAG